MADELIRKSDARKAILHECPSVAHSIERIRAVDAVPVKHAHMIERVVDHECPSYTVFECSQCWTRVETWHKFCCLCGAVFDEENVYVGVTTTPRLSLLNKCDTNYAKQSKDVNTKE